MLEITNLTLTYNGPTIPSGQLGLARQHNAFSSHASRFGGTGSQSANNDRHNIVNNLHPRALTAANITP